MSDDLDDRLSRRFEGENEDETDRSVEPENDTSMAESTDGAKRQSSQKAQNIKKEWNVRSFYLDDNLDDEITTAFKRLDLEFSEASTEVDLKKTRHFYPLLVELGLEQLEEMEITEVTERLERREPK